jgi:hypothetical protein
MKPSSRNFAVQSPAKHFKTLHCLSIPIRSRETKVDRTNIIPGSNRIEEAITGRGSSAGSFAVTACDDAARWGPALAPAEAHFQNPTRFVMESDSPLTSNLPSMTATAELSDLDTKLAGLDKRFAAVDERLADDLRRLDNLEAMIDALKAEWRRQDMRRALWRKWFLPRRFFRDMVSPSNPTPLVFCMASGVFCFNGNNRVSSFVPVSWLAWFVSSRYDPRVFRDDNCRTPLVCRLGSKRVGFFFPPFQIEARFFILALRLISGYQLNREWRIHTHKHSPRWRKGRKRTSLRRNEIGDERELRRRGS